MAEEMDDDLYGGATSADSDGYDSDDDEVVPTNKDQVKSKNLQLPVGPRANTETNGHL